MFALPNDRLCMADQIVRKCYTATCTLDVLDGKACLGLRLLVNVFMVDDVARSSDR